MADADAMQTQYEAAWAGAEASHAQGRQLLEDLTRVGVANPLFFWTCCCLPRQRPEHCL